MKIVVIYGPTAVGKSDIAVLLAKKIDAEIISADSMQIYKDLNVGTAKVTKEEMQNIPHHLIDIKSCTDTYSVFEYVNDCKQKIQEIKNRGKNVVIVGGTGLYLKALTENYNYANTLKDDALREDLNKLSKEELVEKLESLNVELKPEDKNNIPRLIRYYEIYSQNKKMEKSTFNEDYIIFGLNSERKVLYERINKRVDIMVKNGLIEETKYLLSKVTDQNQCLKAIGYKEIIPYIKGEKTLIECTDLLKQKSRNYAKRQITFMNQFKNIIKIDVITKEDAANQIYSYLKK